MPAESDTGSSEEAANLRALPTAHHSPRLDHGSSTFFPTPTLAGTTTLRWFLSGQSHGRYAIRCHAALGGSGLGLGVSGLWVGDPEGGLDQLLLG